MDIHLLKSLILYICLFLGTVVSGSVITFQSNPQTVIEGLTENARLRCSLQDTAASATVIGRRDVTRTTDNVEQVSSIIIMKNGVDVASVAVSHAAKVMVNATNIQVTGDVTKTTGERGFIELVLQYPTPGQVGEYGCEIVAVSSTGHGVIFTTNAEINSSQPTIANLINEINNGKVIEKHQSNLIQTLQQTVASLQQQVQAGGVFTTGLGIQVRLIGCLNGSCGAVQLRHNGATGMLCDDNFDPNNNGATVVCRMLGFSTGVYEDGNDFAGAVGPADPKDMYLLDDVVCNGAETDLTQCSHSPYWGLGGAPQDGHNCVYDELAGVRCT